ncbi:MAG: hypothetical protein MPI95_03350 [Nitrosopumilus sp.]|nr:hypothetical protein [Nitrosopumilus sp.]CAI9831417.1 conserved hypothetical protein [Nitrosopumilaceae archaeon]MDA7940849.1 hypothetical protein [Nitrosopumilus sp.]MDA7943295.1 hypothetical protein [Nitrosopumilus sp.]MDA7944212.1 hypothetical protein [Nitrosopumilus sp.]
MHDDEPETFRYMTWPERFSQMLSEIGVESEVIRGDDPLEAGDCYSRYYSSTPRMVSSRGCLGLSGSNIDAVQIIQKG